MDNFIFDKTDKGREEIITRQYRLASRLRPLLVLIDGKKTTPELLQQVGGLGLDMQSLADLVDGEFIEGVGIVPESGQEQEPHRTGKTGFAAPGNKAAASAGGAIAPEKLVALQQFLAESIKNSLGLRGFTLQLKAEKAEGLADFIAGVAEVHPGDMMEGGIEGLGQLQIMVWPSMDESSGFNNRL